MKKLSRLLVAIFIILGTNISTGLAAPTAATITVNTTTDEFAAGGNCSLREAIVSVNNSDYTTYGCALSGSGEVTIFVPFGDYFLTRTGTEAMIGEYGDLDILTNMTLSGEDRYATVVNGSGLDRVFDVLAGHTAIVAINNLTIRNGNSGSSAGGGIRNNANLTLSSVNVVSNQSGDYGGGIFHKHGFAPASPPLDSPWLSNAPEAILTGAVMTIDNCIIIGNTATGRGGGIANMEESGMIIQDSEITINHAGTDGGGIYNSSMQPFRIYRSSVISNNADSGSGAGLFSGITGGDDVEITDSLFISNTALNAGGGIFHIGDDGIMKISRSTVEHNYAHWGAGLVSVEGLTQVENVTFHGNTTYASPNQGGAIYIHSGTVEIVHSTIAENHADLGAGIYNAGNGTIKSTIIANNTNPSGGSLINCLGSLVSLGFNLSDGSSCSLGVGELFNTDPGLGPYAVHHFSIPDLQTYSLLLGSPAIDAADPVSTVLVDGRNLPRPVDGDRDGSIVNDIGAYEVQPTFFLPIILK
jgi:CSLREA domain-containing protein